MISSSEVKERIREAVEHRGARRREGGAPARRPRLEGALPVPRGADALVHGDARPADVALLRLRQGRRLRLGDGDREGRVPRGAACPRRPRRHRAAEAATGRATPRASGSSRRTRSPTFLFARASTPHGSRGARVPRQPRAPSRRRWRSSGWAGPGRLGRPRHHARQARPRRGARGGGTRAPPRRRKPLRPLPQRIAFPVQDRGGRTARIGRGRSRRPTSRST